MQGMLLSCLMISDWPLESEETIISGEYHLKIHHERHYERHEKRSEGATYNFLG